MGTAYHFVTEWRVAGTIDEVKAILGDDDYSAVTRWWPSVYLDVTQIEEPTGPGGLGRVLDLYTKGWAPYTLRWTLRVTEPLTDGGYALEASGDLEGTGRWTFRQDGPEVVITYDWRIQATKPLLRRLSWLLKPAFGANHHWAMRRGEESLRLELRRRRQAAGAPDAGAPDAGAPDAGAPDAGAPDAGGPAPGGTAAGVTADGVLGARIPAPPPATFRRLDRLFGRQF